VSVDEGDNDPKVLHNRECRAALPVLADHVPGGSRLVLAGRAEPPLRIARLRVEGKVLEIGPGDLSLTRDEASMLLRNAEVTLGEDEVAELHRRTEGWPAGAVPGGALPAGGRPFGQRRGVLRRRGPAGERVHGAGVPGADLPAESGVPYRTAVLERMSGALAPSRGEMVAGKEPQPQQFGAAEPQTADTRSDRPWSHPPPADAASKTATTLTIIPARGPFWRIPAAPITRTSAGPGLGLAFVCSGSAGCGAGLGSGQ
jgi:hypothetical protein